MTLIKLPSGNWIDPKAVISIRVMNNFEPLVIIDYRGNHEIIKCKTYGDALRLADEWAVIFKHEKQMNETKPRIVSAAMLMVDGVVIPGVRHFSPEMRVLIKRLYGPSGHLQVKEQGFIDSLGNFLDREQAWIRAEETNQIIKDVGVKGLLFSENLY